jgi:AcrR family transcriptional regulator
MVKLSAGEKKKQLILDTCKKLFYRKGYQNTTYDDICMMADVPPGSITYHFDGKRNIAGIIAGEYEAQNKIYIEKMTGNKYSKSLLVVIEIFHMWKRLFDDDNLFRFMLDISSERLPTMSDFEVVKYFYKVVLDERGIDTIDEKTLGFIVSSQLGMSDGIINMVALSFDSYTYEEVAEFSIKFFFRQVGLEYKEIDKLLKEGKAIFDKLPIDNRYYRNFKYDETYLTVV